jgi:hypothetical protein
MDDLARNGRIIGQLIHQLERLVVDLASGEAICVKNSRLQAFRDGETRTRTGDTTIFRQEYATLELARKALQSRGLRDASIGTTCLAHSVRM